MFISVKEAIELTGKSQTTIYRLCKKRIRTEYVKVENSQYLIDKDFLLETYPPEEEKLIDIEKEDIINDISKESNSENDIELEIENKFITVDVLADEITERIVKNANGKTLSNKPLSEEYKFNFEKTSYWETIIGIFISVLLIIGFILILYFNSK
ncbi:MAG: hypothetical protein JXR51_15120 [Bacteroidales bacterium]|nr:hypothetical protein [Bacteroidales bacterium]MBN2758503.1 hypothetical protein [Bacteroidales bacterium]